MFLWPIFKSSASAIGLMLLTLRSPLLIVIGAFNAICDPDPAVRLIALVVEVRFRSWPVALISSG